LSTLPLDSRGGLPVFAVTRFRVPAGDVPSFTAEAEALLAALAVRHGFRDGALGRAADDPELFALHTAWDGVGAYRRALSAAEVKIVGAPVWQRALDEPGVFLTE
jgi:antibiotic biosynthesis monooxygenase